MPLILLNSRLALEGGLTRNSYGAGSKTEELEVTAGEGEREKIEVQVSEQAYSGEELKKYVPEMYCADG